MRITKRQTIKGYITLHWSHFRRKWHTDTLVTLKNMAFSTKASWEKGMSFLIQTSLACITMTTAVIAFSADDIPAPEQVYLEQKLSPPTVDVSQVSDHSIKIDGNDDAAWKDIPRIRFVNMRSNEPCSPPEYAKIAWDSKSLYVFCHLNKPEKSNQQTTRICGDGQRRATNENKMFHSNTVMELFIELDDDARNYMEIHLSPFGVVADVKNSCPSTSRKRQRIHYQIPQNEKSVGDWDWNCVDLETTVRKRDDGGWNAEFAIPFDELNKIGKSGKQLPFELRTLKLNLVCATLGVYEAISGWPFKGYNPCHGIDRFATIVLKER